MPRWRPTLRICLSCCEPPDHTLRWHVRWEMREAAPVPPFLVRCAEDHRVGVHRADVVVPVGIVLALGVGEQSRALPHQFGYKLGEPPRGMITSICSIPLLDLRESIRGHSMPPLGANASRSRRSPRSAAV